LLRAPIDDQELSLLGPLKESRQVCSKSRKAERLSIAFPGETEQYLAAQLPKVGTCTGTGNKVRESCLNRKISS